MVCFSVVKMSVDEMARCPSVTIDGTTFRPKPHFVSQINNKLAPSATQLKIIYSINWQNLVFHFMTKKLNYDVRVKWLSMPE
jgi:hypothetical protein